MKKLLVCQFYTPNLKYAEKSEAINRDYCNAHNIDFFCQTDKTIIDKARADRAYNWYKIPLLIELLKSKEYEYVMYIDADAVFVRKDFNIVEILDKNSEHDFICTADFGPDIVNSGVLIFKNTDWSIDFLERVWDSANYISRGKYKLEIWHEQTILSIFLITNQYDRSKTKVLSYADDNSINDNILREGKTLIYHDLSKIRIQELYKVYKGDKDVITELNLTTDSDRQVSHGYGYFYENYISEQKKLQKSVKILDIGGDKGTIFSVLSKYYDNIEYVNMSPHDYIPKSDKIKVFYSSEINETYIDKFIENNTDSYDMIIADYKHTCSVRDLLFMKFFDLINPNGVFVVEDLQTDLEIAIPEKNNQYGWGDPSKKSMTDLITKFNVDSTFDSDYVNFKDLNSKIKKAKIHKCLPFSSLLGLIYKK